MYTNELPDRDNDYQEMLSYLADRGIDINLIAILVKKNKIYQFKNKDESVNMCTKSYSENFMGSDIFLIEPQNANKISNTVYIFDSMIEAMSYYTLCQIAHMKKQLSSYMIAVGNTDKSESVNKFLDMYKYINNIVICFKNDKYKLNLDIYPNKYNISIHLSRLNTWNELLLYYKKKLSR